MLDVCFNRTVNRFINFISLNISFYKLCFTLLFPKNLTKQKTFKLANKAYEGTCNTAIIEVEEIEVIVS